MGLVEKDKRYPIEEAVSLAKKTSVSKFDSSVEIHIRLNVNPSSADQQVRGTVVLPEGTGKRKGLPFCVRQTRKMQSRLPERI